MASANVENRERREWREHEGNRRMHHASKSEGTGRRFKRIQREKEADRALLAGEAVVYVSSPDKVRDLLAKRARIEKQLEAELAALPRGDARQAAVRDMGAAGISKSDMARLMDVSRQRIGQLSAVAEEIPF
jgi:hypothetical protein